MCVSPARYSDAWKHLISVSFSGVDGGSGGQSDKLEKKSRIVIHVEATQKVLYYNLSSLELKGGIKTTRNEVENQY